MDSGSTISLEVGVSCVDKIIISRVFNLESARVRPIIENLAT
jgi:hypothetical protein